MSDETTITFHFQNGLRPAESAVIARAMAELIRLNPPTDDSWHYSLDCAPERAYELGLATAELVDALAKEPPF